MAVNRKDSPAKAAPFFVDRVHTLDLFKRPIKLDTIAIHNSTYIVQPLLCCKQGGFPNLPFLQLTITEQAKNALRHMLPHKGAGQAVGNGQALS